MASNCVNITLRIKNDDSFKAMALLAKLISDEAEERPWDEDAQEKKALIDKVVEGMGI